MVVSPEKISACESLTQVPFDQRILPEVQVKITNIAMKQTKNLINNLLVKKQKEALDKGIDIKEEKEAICWIVEDYNEVREQTNQNFMMNVLRVQIAMKRQCFKMMVKLATSSPKIISAREYIKKVSQESPELIPFYHRMLPGDVIELVNLTGQEINRIGNLITEKKREALARKVDIKEENEAVLWIVNDCLQVASQTEQNFLTNIRRTKVTLEMQCSKIIYKLAKASLLQELDKKKMSKSLNFTQLDALNGIKQNILKKKIPRIFSIPKMEQACEKWLKKVLTIIDSVTDDSKLYDVYFFRKETKRYIKNLGKHIPVEVLESLCSLEEADQFRREALKMVPSLDVHYHSDEKLEAIKEQCTTLRQELEDRTGQMINQINILWDPSSYCGASLTRRG